MNQMCAASESSSPRSYPWVGLTLLCVSISPSNSLKLPWVLRAPGDHPLLCPLGGRIYLMVVVGFSMGLLHITRIDPQTLPLGSVT